MINAVPVIILVRVNLLTKYEKILFVFIILLFFISGIFLGRILERLLILPPSPDVTVEKADERCAKIENNFPIGQMDFDSYGRQLSSTTLYTGVHLFCR